MFAAPSAPDPYQFAPQGPNTGLLNAATQAKTVASQLLDGGIRNCILITAGQSNHANSAPSNYTPTNATKVDNLNICDGGIYRAVDPLLGCASGTSGGAPTGGNFAGRLADKLIAANTFDRVIIVPIAIDGTTVAQWEATHCDRLLVAVRRLAAKGMTATAILWGQGESDHGTSQSAYTSSLTSVINRTRAAGYSGPWFIARMTWLAGSVDSSVQAAQDGIVNHGSGIWAGPNADSLNAAKRQGDNTHFNDTGMNDLAGLWQTALGLYGAPF